jgi:hypothetical protein
VSYEKSYCKLCTMKKSFGSNKYKIYPFIFFCETVVYSYLFEKQNAKSKIKIYSK